MAEPQPPVNGNGLTGADMLALLTHITGLLDAMEGRILDRLNLNSAGAADRWKKHDDELMGNTKKIVERFAVVEEDLLKVSRCLDDHLAKEHEKALAAEVRTAPLRSISHFLVANWKDILILIVGALVILGVLGIEWEALGAR